MATNEKGIVRTKMAAAFVAAADPEKLRGRKLSKVANTVVHRVLTNKARGVGVKYDPRWKKNKPADEVAAVSAVGDSKATVAMLKEKVA